MKANSKSLYFLCILFVFLLFFSIYTLLNTKETTNNVEYLKEGYLKFNDNISFPLDINNEIVPIDHIEHIISETGSKYDSIVDIRFNIDKIGLHRGEITFKYKDIITRRSFMFSVIDTEVPVLYLDKPIIIKQGSELNLEEFVTVKDNSLKDDDKLVPRVIGGFDTTKVGIFNVVIEANDESGNGASFATTITVTDSQGNIGLVNQGAPQESTPIVPPKPSEPEEVIPPVEDNSESEPLEEETESDTNLDEQPQEGGNDE